MLTVTKAEAEKFEVCCGKQTIKHVNTYYTPEYSDEHEYRCMVCHQHKTVSVKKDLDEVIKYREWLKSLKSN
jgi:hypothetical protein